MLEESPGAVAVMLAVLAAYAWYVVDRPLVPKLLTVVLAAGAFLLAMLALERLRDRYGVDLDAD